MEKFNSQQVRDTLAKKIKEAPKKGRKDILEKEKETPEYWQARAEKIHEGQNEEEIENGQGIFLRKKTIYHGSGNSGIKSFNKAEEDTVGSGIYFTSEAKDAIGYARRRSRRKEGSSPIIYESSVENIKLLDLRKDKNVSKILEGFKKILKDKLKNQNLKWNYETILQRAIEAIDSNKIGSGNLREVIFSIGQLFSDYVKSLGYDGLVTFEGGEGEDIGNHDTYLIFDSDKVKINKENKII